MSSAKSMKSSARPAFSSCGLNSFPVPGTRRFCRNSSRISGILDSAPDIDILLLAKELNAAVISQDLGIQRWAEQLGLRYLEARTFPVMIKEYLSRARAIHKSDGLPLYVPPSGEDDSL
jgi:hypothetical protein